MAVTVVSFHNNKPRDYIELNSRENENLHLPMISEENGTRVQPLSSSGTSSSCKSFCGLLTRTTNTPGLLGQPI